MIGYVNFGADDLAAARRFYDAVLLPLGFEVEEDDQGLSYAAPALPGQRSPQYFYITPPFDGAPASVGNGVMVAFEARDQAEVRRLHAAGRDAGGRDEGSPGFRAIYSPELFIGYLRDPQGNKLALYSTNPADPTRDG
ncbi:MAG: VOC family protein [Pseudomonadota bacterium]